MRRREFMAALGGIAMAAPLAARGEVGQVPGRVIFHIPKRSGRYVGSPGLAVLPDGAYLASCDLFGPASAELIRPKGLVFRSEDKGENWEQVATIRGLFWASLFVHRDRAYLLGVDRNLGHAVIMASSDGGRSWTTPYNEKTGLLLRGRNHTAPMPVVAHRGRLHRAMESIPFPFEHRLHCQAFMMSVDEDADLLRADHWLTSNRLPGDPRWLGGRFRGWLEGNAVVTTEGGIVDILRVQEPMRGDTAALVRVSEDGSRADFDPHRDFIDFPGGAKKFTIRFDPASGRYWSLANIVLEDQRGLNPGRVRNTQALVSSPDLIDWTIERVVLHHPEPVRHAFQYLDWLFDNDDVIAASRTAFDDGEGGAHNAHDANYLTFHRFRNFRG